MTDTLRIALAPLNPCAGDLAANADAILAARARAAEAGADLVVTSELSVTGYPVDDLMLRPAFQEAARAQIQRLAQASEDGGPGMIVGAPWTARGDAPGGAAGALYNAAVLIHDGSIAPRLKQKLPDYGVFDESRVFRHAGATEVVAFRSRRLGLMTCEDMWFPDTSAELAQKGAEILIAPHASPFRDGVLARRVAHGCARATETGLPLILVNQLGGQDELVFEGDAFVVDGRGRLQARGPRWTGAQTLTDWRRGAGGWVCAEAMTSGEEIPFTDKYAAMVLGLRDYVGKNGFENVYIGLSGGVDSALTAAVAVDALGAEHVSCVMMPSRYTSAESLEDARACAEALGVSYGSISIAPAMKAFEAMLAPSFEGRAPGVAEENIQSRIRGQILMALSNKFGAMVIATGNKSEYATGYATLYGDMCGAYAPLKDVYKTQVYSLARWRNEAMPEIALGPKAAVIAQRILEKAPSAELKENQTDQDTLPAYDVLDDILERLIEHEQSLADIAAAGHARETVARVARMLRITEYKRFQAAPGPKLTARAFGRDRRYPLTNRYSEAFEQTSLNGVLSRPGLAPATRRQGNGE